MIVFGEYVINFVSLVDGIFLGIFFGGFVWLKGRSGKWVLGLFKFGVLFVRWG